MPIKLSFIVILGCLFSNKAYTQSDSITSPLTSKHKTIYSLEAIGIASTNQRTPFWFQANKFGVIPKGGPAAVAIANISGQHNLSVHRPTHQLDYGIEVVGNVTQQTRILLPEAYVAVNLSYLNLRVGRKKEIIGLGDSTLTSGFYSWSGNATPITKVQVGTNGFAPLGFTNNLISVSAFYAHGWLANTDSIQGAFLHQKGLYIRIGQPSSKIEFTTGVLHNAQWGGRSSYVARWNIINGQLPNSLKDYLYVITAWEANSSDSPNLTEFDRLNRVGNHLGSIDFSLKMRTKNWNITYYYQHPFEDKSGVIFKNAPDGLYGISLIKHSSSRYGIDRILIEYLSTMSQSGTLIGQLRNDGNDDYFNNWQYLNGWTEDRRVIGSPFLTRLSDVRPGVNFINNNNRLWSIINNRVKLMHVAIAGTFNRSTKWQIKTSFSQNYGTPWLPFTNRLFQFSSLASLQWHIQWFGGAELKAAFALDNGLLLPNAAGGSLSLHKTWIK